jgi:hypothetical protein
VPPTVPEDDEVGGVVHLNHPHASRFCVVELWPLDAAPPYVAAALLDPLDAAPPAVAAARLCCGDAAPPSAPTAGLGRLDAATPASVAACRRGNRDAGHLDVDASVGANEGDGWELKCIGGGGAEGYRLFGPTHPCFYYSHRPI